MAVDKTSDILQGRLPVCPTGANGSTSLPRSTATPKSPSYFGRTSIFYVNPLARHYLQGNQDFSVLGENLFFPSGSQGQQGRAGLPDCRMKRAPNLKICNRVICNW